MQRRKIYAGLQHHPCHPADREGVPARTQHICRAVLKFWRCEGKSHQVYIGWKAVYPTEKWIFWWVHEPVDGPCSLRIRWWSVWPTELNCIDEHKFLEQAAWRDENGEIWSRLLRKLPLLRCPFMDISSGMRLLWPDGAICPAK